MFRKFLAIWLILTATIFAVGHSLAQMPGMFQPVLLGTSIVKTLTFKTSLFSPTGTGTATHTYSSVALGSDSFVHIVANGANNTRTFTSVQVNGVSATQNIAQTSGNETCGVFTIANPTGSQNIVINWSGTQAGSAIGVWTSTGLGGTAANSTVGKTANNSAAALSTLAGGFIVAGSSFNDTVSSITWTNATARGSNVGAGTNIGAGYGDNTPTSAGTTNVTSNYGGGGATIFCSAFASF